MIKPLGVQDLGHEGARAGEARVQDLTYHDRCSPNNTGWQLNGHPAQGLEINVLRHKWRRAWGTRGVILQVMKAALKATTASHFHGRTPQDQASSGPELLGKWPHHVANHERRAGGDHHLVTPRQGIPPPLA